MKLSFYGGVQEIGGNKILLEDADTRVFLDFGKSFDRYGRYFEEYLKPRSSCGMADFTALGLVPKIQGVYRDDLLQLLGWESHDEPAVDGVLLSHMHLDHAAYISFLDPRIPIYCSDISKRIAKVLLEAGTRQIDKEILNYKCRPLVNKREAAVERSFQLVEPGKRFRIGSFEVQPFGVCHSIPGALAYIIYCPSGVVAYTGDLRLRGPNAQLTAQFVQSAAKEAPDILLCEGTRIDSTDTRTEEDVKQEASRILPATKELAIADYADRDIARFQTFFQTSVNQDRKLVISKHDAYLLQELAGSGLALPDIRDDHILVYIDSRDTGRFVDTDYYNWERQFLDLPNAVQPDFVHRHQRELVVHLGFYQINELLDIRPASGSAYIHSVSEPHSEEMVIDEGRLNNWLTHFNLPRHQSHASGHANGQDIAHMIRAIRPKKLIPIHTERQELFRPLHDHIEYPRLAPA